MSEGIKQEEEIEKQRTEDEEGNKEQVQKKLKLKTPITLEEVIKVIKTLQTKFSHRSAPGLVIAAYDYMKLWSLPSRIFKMKQLIYQHEKQSGKMDQSQVSRFTIPPQSTNERRIDSTNQLRERTPGGQLRFNYGIQDSKYKQNFQQQVQDSGRAPQFIGKIVPKKRRGRPPKMRPTPSSDIYARFMPPSTKEQKQRIIAQVFLYRGYSLGQARNEVNFKIDHNCYYSLVRSIVFKAFQKLQQVISGNCKLQLVESKQYKLHRFKSQLCRCQEWLQRHQLKTFHEFIRSCYDLNAQAVTKGDAIRLYRVLISHWEIARHQKNFFDRKNHLAPGWDSDYEGQPEQQEH